MFIMNDNTWYLGVAQAQTRGRVFDQLHGSESQLHHLLSWGLEKLLDLSFSFFNCKNGVIIISWGSGEHCVSTYKVQSIAASGTQYAFGNISYDYHYQY